MVKNIWLRVILMSTEQSLQFCIYFLPFPFCSKCTEEDLHSVKFPFPLSTYWFSSVDLEEPLVLTITSSLREYPLGAQGSTSVLFLEEPAITEVINLKRYSLGA